MQGRQALSSAAYFRKYSMNNNHLPSFFGAFSSSWVLLVWMSLCCVSYLFNVCPPQFAWFWQPLHHHLSRSWLLQQTVSWKLLRLLCTLLPLCPPLLLILPGPSSRTWLLPFLSCVRTGVALPHPLPAGLVLVPPPLNVPGLVCAGTTAGLAHLLIGAFHLVHSIRPALPLPLLRETALPPGNGGHRTWHFP